jgi:acetoacetate decarboxylase
LFAAEIKEMQMFAATSEKGFPLKGYSLPLSPKGKTSIVDAPPWYYGGEVLYLTFKADERKVRALIPPPLEMGPNPGQGAVWFVEWVSASEARPDLAFINPERSLYRECFVVVGCQFKGVPGSFVPYIWVDSDFTWPGGLSRGFQRNWGGFTSQGFTSLPRRSAEGRLGQR